MAAFVEVAAFLTSAFGCCVLMVVVVVVVVVVVSSSSWAPWTPVEK